MDILKEIAKAPNKSKKNISSGGTTFPDPIPVVSKPKQKGWGVKRPSYSPPSSTGRQTTKKPHISTHPSYNSSVVKDSTKDIVTSNTNKTDVNSFPVAPIASTSRINALENKIGINGKTYNVDQTILNVPVGTTSTPENLVFRDTDSGIEVKPSFRQKVDTFQENIKKTHGERDRLKQYKIGLTDNDPSQPIYITKTKAAADFGFKPKDYDYMQSDIDLGNIETETLDNLKSVNLAIDSSGDYLEKLSGSLKSVDKNTDVGARWNMDFGNDGVVDTVYSKSRVQDYLKQKIKDVKTDRETYIQDRINIEQSLSDIRNTQSIVHGYRDAGYELDFTESGGYNFFSPSELKVHEWKHGTGLKSNLLLTTSAFLDSPLASRTIGDIVTGYNPKERLASRSLDMTSSLEHKGMTDFIVGDVAGSPAMIEGVYVPMATMGLGHGIGNVAGKSSGFIGKLGGKISGKFGGKTLVSVAKFSGKALSTKTGAVIFTAGLYGVTEGRELYKSYKEDPAGIGGKLTESMFTFGLQLGAFKHGMKSGIKSGMKPVKPKKEFIQARNVNITSETYKGDVKYFKGDMKAYITGRKDPVKVSFEGLSRKQPIDTFMTTNENIIHLTKGKTYSVGKMTVIADSKKGLSRISKAKFYDFVTEGDIVGKTEVFKKFSYKAFRSSGYSWSNDLKTVSHSKAIGVIQSGKPQVTTNEFVGFAQNKKGIIDFNTKIFVHRSADPHSFIMGGKYVTNTKQLGNFHFSGDVLNIKSGKVDTILKIKTKPSIIHSKDASASLVRHSNKQSLSLSFMSDVGKNVSNFNVPSITSFGFSSAKVTAATPVILPILKTKVTRNSTNNSIAQEYKQSFRHIVGGDTTNKYKTEFFSEPDIKTGDKHKTGEIDISGFRFGEIANTRSDSGIKTSLKNNSIQQMDNKLKLDQSSKLNLKLQQKLSFKQITQQNLVITPFTLRPIDFGFTPNVPIPVVPLFARMGGYHTAILDRKHTKRINFISKNQKNVKFSRGLLSDPLSVLRSQIRFGKATTPKATKKLWKQGKKSLFMNVPTKELLNMKIKKKRRKKNVLM